MIVRSAHRLWHRHHAGAHHFAGECMHHLWLTLWILLLAGVALPPHPLAAQSTWVITDQGVEIDFPNTLTFQAQIESAAPIAQVILEYGVLRLTCGQVQARAFPDFTPGTTTAVSWTWEMRQSGSEPPGARIWYRWRVRDGDGTEQVSADYEVVWLDQQHDWHSISDGMLTLHWYDSPQPFAEELLESAVIALEALSATTGVVPVSPVDLYIYASTTDLREAVLYAPGWTGGQAYPAYDIVLIGISPQQIEWGKRTIAHELTHVLVGHLTFSCLGNVPTWLDEGIAVYGEGGLDAPSTARLETAIAQDQLLSIRSLSGSFSEHPDKADLSYSQSYSIVNFLINAYGSQSLLDLFSTLRDGMTIEAGLQMVYGLDLDSLEDQWREAVGAPARTKAGTLPTATLLPSPVPTYPPLMALPVATAVPALIDEPPVAMPTGATANPTAVAGATGVAIEDTAPDPSLPAGQSTPLDALFPHIVAIGLIACAVLLVFLLAAVLLLIYSHRQSRVGSDEVQQ